VGSGEGTGQEGERGLSPFEEPPKKKETAPKMWRGARLATAREGKLTREDSDKKYWKEDQVGTS